MCAITLSTCLCRARWAYLHTPCGLDKNLLTCASLFEQAADKGDSDVRSRRKRCPRCRGEAGWNPEGEREVVREGVEEVED